MLHNIEKHIGQKKYFWIFENCIVSFALWTLNLDALVSQWSIDGISSHSRCGLRIVKNEKYFILKELTPHAPTKQLHVPLLPPSPPCTFTVSIICPQQPWPPAPDIFLI